MKLSMLNYIRITAISLFSIGLINCTINTPNEAENPIPVSWNTGFTMSTLLASPNISLNSTEDLPNLISEPWYANVGVKHSKEGNIVLSSCADYFDKAEHSTRTIKDNEMNAYLEFKIMCEATQLLMDATNPKESFLPSTVLNAATPKLWPKKIALQISEQKSKRINLKTWADVTPIIKIKTYSDTKSTYFHKGGYQELEVLGNGDANGDNIEDVFIVVRDYVEGGNYFNMRLFVLSVNTWGNWELIKNF